MRPVGHAALLDIRNDEGFSWFLTGCKETKPVSKSVKEELITKGPKSDIIICRGVETQQKMALLTIWMSDGSLKLNIYILFSRLCTRHDAG